MYVILLFLLVSNVFSALFAMEDPSCKSSLIQAIVHNVYNGEVGVTEAEDKIRALSFQGEDPNCIIDGRTAAELSADYCVHQSNHFEVQLDVLGFLLKLDEARGLGFNKEKIAEFLKEEKSGVETLNCSKSGENRQHISAILSRISQVESLVTEHE